ncbi:hypothetical protein BD779DRAFT_1677403 [Infundibulicybe gibba]|nr:hypothetical protein BD779DRAFT_1677403 [Infundibulicybe gibba]
MGNYRSGNDLGKQGDLPDRTGIACLQKYTTSRDLYCMTIKNLYPLQHTKLNPQNETLRSKDQPPGFLVENPPIISLVAGGPRLADLNEHHGSGALEPADTLADFTEPRHEKNIDDYFRPPDSGNEPDVGPPSGSHPPSPCSQLPTELLTHIFTLACNDDGITGGTLSLVSRAFREAVKPIVLRTVNLHSAGHVSWLERLLAIDRSAKIAVRHLRILLSEKEGDLTKREADWELMPMEDAGSLFWDAVYWDFLDGDYTDRLENGCFTPSESSEDADEDEEADLLEDLAFFASEESQDQSSLVRNEEGNVVDEVVSPQLTDSSPRDAKCLIASSISTIIQELAPVLQKLKLVSTVRPYIMLPHCPALTSLEINTPFLIHLDNDSRAAFPILKRLHLQGPVHEDYINVDTIISNAPVLTHLRIPFSEDRLHALVSALDLFPDSADPICRTKYRFAHIEHIALVYYDTDPTGALSRLTGMISNTWEKTIVPLRRRMG